MAQQIINIGTSPNDGTGDTVRDAFDKVNDNFTEVYDGLFVPLAGTDVGAPITGEVVFDEDVFETFKTATGANDGVQINGQQLVIQGENSTSVLNSLTTICYGNNAGSIIKQQWNYGDGQQTFNFPTLGSTDNFQVNWPAKGGTVAMTSDITAGSGTVTSVGLTAGTTGTDINVSGSPVTTSGSITLNIPTASATNRGALSSADWTTFNNKVSMLHSTNVLSATHTGTTANTLLTSYLISANSIADNQTIEFEFKASKLNATSGAVNWRIYINTSASLTGATQIAYYQLGSAANAQNFGFRRRFHRRSGNLLHFPATTSGLTEYTGAATVALASSAVTFSSDQYIIIACELASSGQQTAIESAQITRI
jgi:hypothetical protein